MATKTMVKPRPCAKCPYRKDVPIYLHVERRQQIMDAAIHEDQYLPCHEHTVYDEETDDMVDAGGPMCAGQAKSVLLAHGSLNIMRIAGRLGAFDPDKLERTRAKVWTPSEWVRVPEGATGDTWSLDEEPEIITCVNSDHGCLAPAGYLGSGGAVIEGTESADGECATCGEGLCSNCADEDGNCTMCSDEDDG